MPRLEFASPNIAESTVQGEAPEALFELGLMYCSGREVKLDLVTAHKWFNLAAMRGSEEARRYRLEIAREMTRSEVARAQKLAREWLARHSSYPAEAGAVAAVSTV